MKEAEDVLTGPKERLHLFGFMDETGLLTSPKTDRIFGIGIVVLPKTKHLHDEIIKLRQRSGYTKEFKFSQVRRNNLKLYKQLVDIFFNTIDSRFAALVIDKQKIQIRSPKHTKAYNSFAGELISNVIDISKNKSEYITILADDVSTSINDRYEKEIRQKVRRSLRRDALFGVCRLESHALSEIQLCDVLTGAVAYSFKMQKNLISSPLKSKQELIKYIQNKIGIDQLSKTFKNHCGKNVKFFVTEKQK